jgi:hypothetical protein
VVQPQPQPPAGVRVPTTARSPRRRWSRIPHPPCGLSRHSSRPTPRSAGFSNDPEVRTAVSDREYGVIVIDGDHSEEGVREDLEWAETIAASGAIVARSRAVVCVVGPMSQERRLEAGPQFWDGVRCGRPAAARP